MNDFLILMAAPFAACLVLVGIHAYMGIHVLAREVIFVDLSLAQIAALGTTLAFLMGYGLESRAAYWRLGAWVGILVLTTVVLVAAGLCASSLMPSTASATAASYAFSATLCLGTLAVLLLGSRVSPVGRAVVLTLNPLAAALQVASDHWFSDLPLLFGNRLWENHLYLSGGVSVLLLVVAGCRVRLLFQRRD